MIFVVLISAIVLFPYHNSDICSANICDCVISISYSDICSANICDCVILHIMIVITGNICSAMICDCVILLSLPAYMATTRPI